VKRYEKDTKEVRKRKEKTTTIKNEINEKFVALSRQRQSGVKSYKTFFSLPLTLLGNKLERFSIFQDSLILFLSKALSLPVE